jgi:competence protein ComEC
MLDEQQIQLMTTKTDDIIVKSIGDHTGEFKAINLIVNSKGTHLNVYLHQKKKLLTYNADTLREFYAKRPVYPR